MSHRSKPKYPSVLPTQVWPSLALERRSEIIRFMAQLAFKLVNAQSDSIIQETHHVNHVLRPDTQQNSHRAS